jgi:hypothetical protein
MICPIDLSNGARLHAFTWWGGRGECFAGNVPLRVDVTSHILQTKRLNGVAPGTIEISDRASIGSKSFSALMLDDAWFTRWA